MTGLNRSTHRIPDEGKHVVGTPGDAEGGEEGKRGE